MLVPLAEGTRIAINPTSRWQKKNDAPPLLRVHSKLTDCPSVIYGPAVSSICSGLITRVVTMTLLSLSLANLKAVTRIGEKMPKYPSHRCDVNDTIHDDTLVGLYTFHVTKTCCHYEMRYLPCSCY